MYIELESTWKQSWPNLGQYPGIFLEELRKTMANLSQNS
jgi:hypothetical protein